ncbi:MAG: DUF3365 domain-containing protein [Pseudomonadota bacterium]
MFRNGTADTQIFERHESGLFDRRVKLATPVRMGEACVSCHNSHPESPRKDWVEDEVRGIQTFMVSQTITPDIATFKWLLVYVAFAGSAGIAVSSLQFRQARSIMDLNAAL